MFPTLVDVWLQVFPVLALLPVVYELLPMVCVLYVFPLLVSVQVRNDPDPVQ